MPATSFSFSIQYAGNGTGVNAGGGDAIDESVTITAVIEDGVISVGDQVTASGMNIFVSGDTGISDGVPFTYLGTGNFGGVEGFVFTSDGSLTNPDAILVLTNEMSPSGPTQQAVQAFSTDTSTQMLGADPACFLAGTRIATPDGPRDVETLEVGDLVMTADGRAVAVRFNHKATVMPGFNAADRLQPVQIAAGALGHDLPERDLQLTPDHALLLDGALVEARALLGLPGVTKIPTADLGERYMVHHIETEGHEVILAERIPAETFINYVGRRAFDNYAEYTSLYGEDQQVAEMAAPRIASADLLPPVLRARFGLCASA